MDKALWITWYDLPEQGREAHLAWLHASYIPSLLKRPGFLWAAHYATVKKENARGIGRNIERTHGISLEGVPRGQDYILMFGAAHAHVFGDPTPSELNAGLPEADRRMLSQRVGERVNVMMEAARVDGPEAEGYTEGMAPAPCIQLGSYNCAWQDEDQVMAWYAQSRMPAMSTLPGSIRTRRLASVSGWAKHAILYEFVSQDARDNYYLTMENDRPDLKAWSDRTIVKLGHATGGGANLARRIWPA